MENKKFLSQSNELGPNFGKAIRTETERRNLGVYVQGAAERDARDLVRLVCVLVILTWCGVLA